MFLLKLTQDPPPHLGREGPLVGWLGLARDNKANRRRIEVAKNVEMWWLDHFVPPFFFPHLEISFANPIDDIAGGTNVGIRRNSNGEVCFARPIVLLDMLHDTVRGRNGRCPLDVADHCGAYSIPLDCPHKTINLDNISYRYWFSLIINTPEKIFNE